MTLLQSRKHQSAVAPTCLQGLPTVLSSSKLDFPPPPPFSHFFIHRLKHHRLKIERLNYPTSCTLQLALPSIQEPVLAVLTEDGRHQHQVLPHWEKKT